MSSCLVFFSVEKYFTAMIYLFRLLPVFVFAATMLMVNKDYQ